MNQHLDLLGDLGRQHDGPILFIADAGNRLERRLIEKCLGAGIDRVFLPISKEKQLDLGELSKKLEASGNTLLVPVRVAWLMPESDDKTNKPLALRHLMFGDPRHPGFLRGNWILHRDANRAECIAGEPGSIAAL